MVPWPVASTSSKQLEEGSRDHGLLYGKDWDVEEAMESSPRVLASARSKRGSS